MRVEDLASQCNLPQKRYNTATIRAAASPTTALPKYRASYFVAAMFAVGIAGLGVDAVVNVRLLVDAALLFEAGLLVSEGMTDVAELVDGAELVDRAELVNAAELVVVAVTINSLS
jgi:hypothetical protein